MTDLRDLDVAAARLVDEMAEECKEGTMGLEYAGFHKHRAGYIHIFCPHCGLKRSNMPRSNMDPPTATLVAIPCEACSEGCEVDGPSFYRDAEGRELCQFCGDHDCENAVASGRGKRCDERLVDAEVERSKKAFL